MCESSLVLQSLMFSVSEMISTGIVQKFKAYPFGTSLVLGGGVPNVELMLIVMKAIFLGI